MKKSDSRDELLNSESRLEDIPELTKTGLHRRDRMGADWDRGAV